MKMRIIRLSLLLSVLFNVLVTSGQVAIIDYPNTPETYTLLSDKVDETSGLIYYDNDVWTFNDSGGKPEIYRIDKESGEIKHTVVLKNAKNVDWEDITHDEDFIYVGDFGNNKGNRRDLKIYIIDKKNIGDERNVEVPVEVVEFSYSDQKSFEVQNRMHDFDCEAMICFNNSLILFTKNWTNGKTRMYKLPKSPGSYEISPMDEFDSKGLVTGADFNSKTKELVLIGYTFKKPFIFLFKSFIGTSLTSDNILRINFPKLQDSQTEGIAWISDQAVVISSERTKKYQQRIYILNLEEAIKP